MNPDRTTGREILASAEAEICSPWLRHILPHADWTALVRASIAEGWPLLAHWADTVQAHALFLDPDAVAVMAVSTPVEAGRYPALSPLLPGAAWYERMIHDLWGHAAEGGVDARPWLDHGVWPQLRPMAARPESRTRTAPPILADPDLTHSGPANPDTADPDAGTAMVLPLGPIWGRLEEAAHLRLTLDGPAISRAESFLGFTHKGTLALMRGKSPRAAARFASRLSGDATVAHATAFAQAAEAALGVTAPARAAALRIVMLEVERIAGHLDNLAEIGRLAGAASVWTRCGALREDLLLASEAAFGHRLMMDCVVPGGVAADIAEGGSHAILRALGTIASELEPIRRLHARGAFATRLAGLGRADAALVAALGIGGIVGRASGRAFDVRAALSPGYATLAPRVALHRRGDAAARQQLRIFEIGESMRLVGAMLEAPPDGKLPHGRPPDGKLTIALPHVSGEGIACVESVRGDVWHWLRLDHGQIAAAFPRDPGWALWPLAERALEGAPPGSAADVALIRASFALPASGMDL